MKKNSSKLYLCLALLTGMLTVSACNEKDLSQDFEQATLKNLTGLDGCGWIIQLNEGSRLEPTNLDSFNLILSDNMKVQLKYHESPNQASYCMVGKVVVVEEIHAAK